MGRRSKPSQSQVQQSSVDGGRPCSWKAWAALSLRPRQWVSLVIRVSFYLQRQGGNLSHGRLSSCSQEDREEGQCPSCISYFLSNFNSK